MSSGVNYTNRKGILYHLGQGETKTGKTRYFFSPRAPENPVSRVPEGFEIAESVNGVVSLRGLAAQLTRPEELRLIQAELGRHPRSKSHRADSARDAITVYEPFGFLSEVFTGSISDAISSPGIERFLQNF